MTGSPALTRTREEGCLSDLTLDRLLAGELDGQDAAVTAEKHLAGCSRCSERLATLRLEQRRFPEEVWIAGAALKAKKAAAAGSRSRWTLPASALALAATLAGIALTLRPPASDTRPKGGELILELAVLHPDGRQELLAQPPATLSADDKVQFLVTALQGGWGMVLDVDARGVTLFPEAGPVKVAAGKGQLGEQSFVLDGSLGPERFQAIVCPDRARVALLPDALRHALSAGLASPSLPEGCQSTVFPITKVPRVP